MRCATRIGVPLAPQWTISESAKRQKTRAGLPRQAAGALQELLDRLKKILIAERLLERRICT